MEDFLPTFAKPKVIGTTGPSYQNESSDSVSRKLLDEFENAFNTK